MQPWTTVDAMSTSGPSSPSPPDSELDDVIVILNDGQTFTNLRGCTLMDLPAELADAETWEVEEWIRLHPEDAIDLTELVADTARPGWCRWLWPLSRMRMSLSRRRNLASG